jgi:peptidase, M16 family
MMRLRTIFMSIALCTLATLSAKEYSFITVKGDAMQTRIYTLNNGLKVYMSVNKERPRLQANIVVRTGSRNDPAETTGLAHYLEHLMFKGTQRFGTTDYAKEKPYLDEIERRYEQYRTLTDPVLRRTAYHQIDSISQLAAQYNIPNEYDKLMSSIGSEGTNAYTSNDVTCYVENIPSNEIDNWARIQADRFQNMVIRGFHTELEAVYEEKNISMASDGSKEYAALWKLLTPTHPYGTQTTIGEQEHLKNPSIVNIKNYFHRYYVPNNVAIVLAGDFNPDETIAIIDKYFGQWKPSTNLTRPEFPVQPKITVQRDTTVIGQDAENLMMAWRFKGDNDMQSDTLDIVRRMLYNGQAGLIDVNLLQKMKVQDVGIDVDGLHDYSAFIIEASPLHGQTLQQVKKLLLEQVDKLAQGQFSDKLLPAVMANKKLRYFEGLQNNRTRASYMVDAFVNDKRWEDVALQIQRQEKFTKQDIQHFVAQHFGSNNLVCVYKEQGVDSTLKKIEKPIITPIPANREYESALLKSIRLSKTTPIQPVFIDYNKELSLGKKVNGMPLIYKRNPNDGLFVLSFYYDFGTTADKRYRDAADYLDYIGTQNMTVSQLKQAFYNLACQYNVNVSANKISVTLAGLSENMPRALQLLEQVWHKAKADKNSWSSYCDMVAKSRTDQKQSQKANFSALWDYARYGAYNPTRNICSDKQLRATNPQEMVQLITNLTRMPHSVLYYGPLSEQQLINIVQREHKVGKTMLKKPVNKDYQLLKTPQNEVLLAPFKAKNIYLRQFHNEGNQWNVNKRPVEMLFNQYFGGGMNSIVFQELRETRGLAYNAGANYVAPDTKGKDEYFYTHIISQNDKMNDCLRVFNDIVNNMPENEAAFDLAKQSLIKSIQSDRTTRYGVITSYLRLKQLGLSNDYMQQVYNALPKITLKDVANFARLNIANKTYRYTVLGDEKELDMKALEKIAPVKRLSTEEIFGY